MDPNSEISEAVALLAVSALKGVGYSALYNLMDRGVSPLEVLDTETGEEALTTLRSSGARSDTEQWTRPWAETRQRILDRGQGLFDSLKAQGVSVVFRENSEYPRQLLDLKDAPHWLFIQGNAKVLSTASVAAVGTRTPSPNGVWLARYVGLCLQHWQAPTVSGLALGIDQEIHLSSIEQGLPTIAVLGTGILTDYPKNARSLREEIIVGGGAIVSEYLPNESYSGQNFVHRNRLQAALSKVLIPVEWAEKSGTAHTVRYAAGLKRPLAGLQVPNVGQSTPLPVGDDIGRFIDCCCLALGDWFWALEEGPLRVYSIAPLAEYARRYPTAGVYSTDAKAAVKMNRGNLLYWGRLMAARIFFSGLGAEANYVAPYPGHSTESKSMLWANYLRILAGSLQAQYLSDLIVRHRTANKSQTLRTSGGSPDHRNQLSTVSLRRDPIRTGPTGSRYKSPPLRAGRTVLVVDDVCTEG